MHIISEKKRIEDLEKCLADPNLKDGEKTDEISRLMNESFRSQKENFSCVTEEIDNLREMMMSFGALGCRLCNTGWGGSLVGLVPLAKATKIVDFLMKDFYMDPKHKAFVNDDLNMLVFQSSAGASVKYVDPQFEVWF